MLAMLEASHAQKLWTKPVHRRSMATASLGTDGLIDPGGYPHGCLACAGSSAAEAAVRPLSPNTFWRRPSL